MRKLLLALFAGTLFLNVVAQQTSEQYNIPINYLLYLPEGYQADSSYQWPLMIFLHGSGESGSPVEKVKLHGPPKMIAEGKKFPCIVISPQAASSRSGWEPELLIKLIRNIGDKYRVDKNRVYLTGLSMGGYGTWNLAMKYPSEFAAIVPICGGGDITNIRKLRKLPVWCFHGAKDEAVKPSESIRLIDTLKTFNPNVRFTLYPEASHDSWTQTYNNDSVFSWLFAQRRKAPARLAISPEQLKQFVGSYAQKGNDTADLIIKDGKLVVKQHSDLEFIPSGKDEFFVYEGEKTSELEFKRNKKGKIDHFILYADKERIFYKVR